MHYSSQEVAEKIQRAWARMDAVCPPHQADSEMGKYIGFLIPRPIDDAGEIGDFCFMLIHLVRDAAASDSDVGLFESSTGFHVVTNDFKWAKRLVGILIDSGVAIDTKDMVLLTDQDLGQLREIAPWVLEAN